MESEHSALNQELNEASVAPVFQIHLQCVTTMNRVNGHLQLRVLR